MKKKLLLIDGNSLVYRAYFATAVVQKDKIFNSQNIPVNAIRTFCTMIKKAQSTYSPSHMLVAFDMGSVTKRHSKLETYKGNRQKTPDSLIQQMPIIKEMLKIMKIQYFEKEGEEADDIIASATKMFTDDVEFSVLSSDKDLYQLVNKKTCVINPQNGNKEDKIINMNNFFEINSFLPNQVCDFKGLAGDSSDNLQGIKGVGPKQSIKLLQDYGNLENIYTKIDQLKGSLKEKLLKDKEMAFLCKEIATLNYDVELPFEINDLNFVWKPNQNWVNFFRKYEIFSLVKNFEENIEKKSQKTYSKISF